MKLALPKGRLLLSTSNFLKNAGLELSGYDEQSRSYRPECSNFPNLSLKIFHERDIPIQVAVGNYDLGICGLEWAEELLAKYPNSALVKLRNLGYGKRELYTAISKSAETSSIEGLRIRAETIRIATEYPNLAESFALNSRLRRFKIFPLWGSAEAYPPECADIALICGKSTCDLGHELVPLTSILQSSAFLIAHRNRRESEDVGALLNRLYAAGGLDEEEAESQGTKKSAKKRRVPAVRSPSLWLALPDGHQQQPTLEFLNRSGIRVEDYSSKSRRPSINLDEVGVKVIRPQDMPLQVANENFDLAITGRDWLYDHLYRFPSSPVKEILDLGFGGVRIVAVVSNKLPVNNVQDLRELLRKGILPNLRIASEYINIADKYARDNHLSPYRLIPTWGASEVFLPEDADLLIENVQTGRTLARHKLKVIDTLFESSACLIGNINIPGESSKKKGMDYIVQMLRQALAAGES